MIIFIRYFEYIYQIIVDYQNYFKFHNLLLSYYIFKFIIVICRITLFYFLYI